MQALPSGTVTFLFTDIEGSTRYWEVRPDLMRPALDRHDQLMRLAIADNKGYVFKTVGDAFCAAFATAPEAVAGALAAQQALFAEPWGAEIPLRVRMALHTGTTEEWDGDYFGPPVNRVARLMAAGHGGQTLLSLATFELTRDLMPQDAGATRPRRAPPEGFGPARARLPAPAPDLPADFPPLRSLDNPDLPNNLPQQPTSFIGREREVAQVKALHDRNTPADAGRCRWGGGRPGSRFRWPRTCWISISTASGWWNWPPVSRSRPGPAGGGKRAGRARSGGPGDHAHSDGLAQPSACC